MQLNFVVFAISCLLAVSVGARMHYSELMRLMHAFLPTAEASLVAAVTHQVEIVRSGTQTLAEIGWNLNRVV